MPYSYVISDIHGCCKTFKVLLEQIQLSKQDKLYLLGDYIDRGPDSKGVIDHIIFLQESGYNVYPLKGNHEQMMVHAFNEEPYYEKSWKMNGGDMTLKSFGVTMLKDIPQKYISFSSSLLHYIELEKYILVHAGLNFERDDVFEDDYAMLWLRNYIVRPEKINNKIIVQGHTPTPLEAIEASIENAEGKYRIWLDNGCVYGPVRSDMGNLCCLRLEDRKLFVCSKTE
jgi:serine/threonine protein phosphatase 1